jgi:hypothetical protein
MESMTPCRDHRWRTTSSNDRYVVVACDVCGEVRGGTPAYLEAELSWALTDRSRISR